MRQALIFGGSSHPVLVDCVCERLGLNPARADLGKFSNGETKVNLHTSIRDQDVFIIQSGSNKINDNVMELLIMISACKSGSARSITAVMPYFPYSRQSKKKSHRGSITARMLANLLQVAGINHVITIDLHSSQMQGFFHCPVDNLVAEPLIAHWIRLIIPDWKRAVVVSKNPGGTKRVTSLADALKLDFGIIMTDQRRPSSIPASMNTSAIFDHPTVNAWTNNAEAVSESIHSRVHGAFSGSRQENEETDGPGTPRRRIFNVSSRAFARPLQPHVFQDGSQTSLSRAQSATSIPQESLDGSGEVNGTDLQSHDVVTGRLIHGHIVDDDAPPFSPPQLNNAYGTPSHSSNDNSETPTDDNMFSSFYSTASSLHFRSGVPPEALGGSADAIGSDDEEENLKNPELESTVTLVGNVRDRPVLIMDDMIDKSASWIAAAETVIKKGGATGVWCMATHGIFDGGKSLLEMQRCDCIQGIVVTNAVPIPGMEAPGFEKQNEKLSVLDVSHLLAEAIRRTHYGESISQLLHHE